MKISIRSLILLISCFLIHFSLFSQTKDFQKANAAARSYIQKKSNKGLVIGIIKDGKTKVLGYGQLSAANKQTPDGNTLFEIGSATSVFTTTLTKLEEQKGAFKMEERIQDHFMGNVKVPSFRPEICFERKITDYPMTPMERDHDYVVCLPMPMAAPTCITFCHLAFHTAGFPNNPKGLFSWNPIKKNKQKKDPYVDFSKDELYDSMSKIYLNYRPGSVFDYSNWGIAVLGNLVADISNQPYEALLKKQLLEPLQLNDTRVYLSDNQKSRLATGHSSKGRVTAHWHFQSMAPAIGLKSSANDLLAFVANNLKTNDPKVASAFEQVQQSQVETYQKKLGRLGYMGYGWFTSTLNEATNLPVQWVNGGTGGFRAFIGFNKDTQSGVVVLSNSANEVDELGFLFLEGLVNTKKTTEEQGTVQVKN